MSLLFDHITSGMPLAGPRSHPTPTPKKKHANFPSAASRRSPSALLLGAALSGESAWPVGSPHLPPCSSLSRRSLPVSSSSRRPTPAEGPPFPLPTSQAVAMSSSGKFLAREVSQSWLHLCVKVMTDEQMEVLRKQISIYATICEQLVEMHCALTAHQDSIAGDRW
nr:uncharacterized protein LOC109748470 isoform X5 [Aegilops tauschii subsp. strangulata]